MAKWATYCIAIILGLNCILWFLTALRFIAYPYSIDFGEGILLVQSVMLSEGKNIYPPIDDYPFIVSNYHPLYPFLNSIFFWFMEPGLWSGRLISLLSAWGSIVVVVHFVFRATRKVELGIIAGLLPLCLSYPYNWSLTYRVDYTGIFLTLLGLYLYVYPPKKGGIFVSIIPFALAFLTKLNFLLAPLACLIDLFSKKHEKRFLYLGFLIAAIVLPYAIINLVTAGGLFLHSFVYTVNVFHFSRMVEGYREILKVAFPLICVAFMGLANPQGKHKTLFVSYLLLLFMSLVTYGAEGSDSNYYIELIFALSLAAILWIPSGIDLKSTDSKYLSYGFAIVLIFIFIFNSRFMHARSFIPPRNLSKSVAEGQNIDLHVRSNPGEVISEDATFLARNGKEMLFQPYIMSLLARQGKWDQTPFVTDIENKRFNLIILRTDINDPRYIDMPEVYREAGFDRFTREMEQAIRENYTMLQPFHMFGNSWFMYIPKIEY